MHPLDSDHTNHQPKFMKMYVIHWTSKGRGRSGTGTKLLDKHQAESLAAELNRDYPAIYHEAIVAAPELACATAG